MKCCLRQRAIFSTALQICILAALFCVKAQAAETLKEHSSFDLADRLAVINLVNSYGPLYDGFKMKEWRELFAERPIVQLWLGDKKLIDGIDNLLATVQKRQNVFKREQNQRRHFLTPRFISQDAKSMVGEAYLLLLTNRGEKPDFVTTGRYEFTALKEQGKWTFSRWIMHLDNPPD